MEYNIFNKAINSPGEWLVNLGEYSHIALSCRIRLARNLKQFKFPHYITDTESAALTEKIENIMINNDILSPFETYKMSELSISERRILIERHLISKDLAAKDTGALITRNDEQLSIMVNEEDHLRLQNIRFGLQLKQLWQEIDKLDDFISENIEYAFSEDYGYLTACPTNVGTGMRCSLLVHLPAIAMINRLEKIKSSIKSLGLTIRGYYGEGSEFFGNFFQISNQITLGVTEEETIEKIYNIARKIIEHEEDARKILMQESKIRLEDQIFRAYGLLQNARIISTEETMNLLSLVRLGVDLKIITDIPITMLNEMIVHLQPGHLQMIYGNEIPVEKRDFIRAFLIREYFFKRKESDKSNELNPQKNINKNDSSEEYKPKSEDETNK